MTQEAEAQVYPDPIGQVAGWILVIAAFLIGFINFPLQVVGRQFDYLPGDGIDNRLNNFVLEHGYRYLTGRAESFWDAPAFYPARHATRWSDAHLGMLPVYSAFRTAGLSPEGAFQGWFLIPFVLNFVAASWALRRLGAGFAGVAAGAYLFTYGLPLAGQLVHAQLFPRFLVPPAVVFAWEFLHTPRTWRLAACAGCGVHQTYVSVYVAYFLLLLLAVGLLLTVARFRQQLPWAELLRPGLRTWATRAAVCATAAIAVLPLGIAHARGIGSDGPGHVRRIAPQPAAWFTPPDVSASFSILANATPAGSVVGSEQQAFPGFIPLSTVGFGLWMVVWPLRFRERASGVAVAAWTTLFLAVLVTPLGGVWLYGPFARLPGGDAIRAVGRVVLVLLFPMAVVVARGVDAVVRWVGKCRPAVALVGVVVIGVVVSDQWLISTNGTGGEAWLRVRYPRALVGQRQGRLTDAVSRHPAPTILYVFPSLGEGSLGEVILQLEAMRAAQDAGVPCVNGWSGYVAPGSDFFPGYRSLMVWLTEMNHVSREQLAGLVVIGEPVPDGQVEYEAAMRITYPPQRVR